MFTDKRFSRSPFGGGNIDASLFRASLGLTSKIGIRLDQHQVRAED